MWTQNDQNRGPRAFAIASVAFMWLTIGAAQAADKSIASVQSKGDTLVVAAAGNLTIRVKIVTHEMQIGKPSDGRPTVIETSCTYSRYPCSTVDSINITVNGNQLFIPRSVFADLADLNTAEINVSGKNFVLRLGGGDASEVYIAKVEFDATRVKRRTLASGTLPNKPLQETIYHEVIEGD